MVASGRVSVPHGFSTPPRQMHNSKYHLLTGPELLIALYATVVPVKVLGRITKHISPILALNLARGGTYQGYGTVTRVRHIREIQTRRASTAGHLKVGEPSGFVAAHGVNDRTLFRTFLRWSDQRSVGGH